MNDDNQYIPDDEFWNLADAFIDVANQKVRDGVPIGKLSSAIMYAAARFNSFAIASITPNLSDVQDEALSYLTSQYEKMCKENLFDHAARQIDPE